MMESDAVGLSPADLNEVPHIITRTVGRRRSYILCFNQDSSRKVNVQQRKRILLENANKLMLSIAKKKKKSNKITITLGTIAEEPETDNTTEMFIDERKTTKPQSFQFGTNNYKIAKRKEKIKKVFGNRSFQYKKKIPMEVFFKCLKIDDPAVTRLTSTEAKH